MERFTMRIADKVYFTKGKYKETIPAECESWDIREILKRLADYEDTGLEPGEIKRAGILAKAYLAEALKENERAIAIIKAMGAGTDTYEIEEANADLESLLIKFGWQQQVHDAHVNKTCSTCEYWLEKYQKCENTEQPQSEADDYASPPNKTCDLWESNR